MKPADEALHAGDDLYVFAVEGLTVTVAVSGARALYHATFLTPEGEWATVYSMDLARPRQGVLLRGDGMWADHECETPFEHWTVGLEAFAVVTPAEPVGDLATLRGDLVALGLDVEWTSTGAIEAIDGGYRIACAVEGEILYGVEVFSIQAEGWRSHIWTEA